ncbi:hypothetical protein DSECCO2_585880 [anaerobic digester metagenome]
MKNFVGCIFSSRCMVPGILPFLRISRKPGYLTAATQSGITLRGPMLIFIFLTQTWLSPPIAEVSMRIALTFVCQPPTTAPSEQSSGSPFSSMESSVLVPPTSITAQVSSPERWDAPTRLAAGPEKIDSIGFSRASLMPTTEPSHLSMSSLASIPLRLISSLIERINWLAIGISWALR